MLTRHRLGRSRGCCHAKEDTAVLTLRWQRWFYRTVAGFVCPSSTTSFTNVIVTIAPIGLPNQKPLISVMAMGLGMVQCGATVCVWCSVCVGRSQGRSILGPYRQSWFHPSKPHGAQESPLQAPWVMYQSCPILNQVIN